MGLWGPTAHLLLVHHHPAGWLTLTPDVPRTPLPPHPPGQMLISTNPSHCISCLIKAVNWGAGGGSSSLQTRLGRMLQSSDSTAACVQTQQRREKGKIKSWPKPQNGLCSLVPRIPAVAKAPGWGRKQEVQAGLQEAGCIHPGGGVEPRSCLLTPGGTRSSKLCDWEAM